VRRAALVVVLGAAVVSAAGCAGRDEGSGETGTGGANGGNGGGGGSSAAMNVGMTPPASAVGATCSTSQPAPPLLRRLTAVEYGATLRAVFPLLDAPTVASLSSLSEDSTSKLAFKNDAALLLVGQQAAAGLQKTAESTAAYLTDPSRLASWLSCASAANAACAATFVGDYGKRLFRRPLTDAEKQQYTDLYTSVSGQAGFALGIKWTLAAMLQSPKMVYRSEIGAVAGGKYQLSQYELATELAYDFSGGPPDDTLMGHADRGELNSADVLVAEAKRLLATQGGRDLLDEMFREWAQYDRMWDAGRAPAADFVTVWPNMQEEAARFIQQVVITQGGGLTDLLTAPYTMMNGALATYYGYGSPGSGWGMVARPASWGVGLLAQGAFVAGHAYNGSTSPTQRGLAIYERFLCNDRPTPPAGVPTISDPQPGVKTTRQRYEEAHLAANTAFCGSCHTQFDPIGFAFEHFDQAGRYRADEGGLPIVTTGHLPKPSESVTFDGEAQLAMTLATTPQVANCVGGLLESFVYGGAGGQVCLAADARQKLIGGQIGLLEFIAQLAAAPNFGNRTAPAN
jgi:hypothetical protein